jgi:hypothetical protein
LSSGFHYRTELLPAVWKQNMLDTEQNLQAWLGSAERKTNWD